MVLGPFAFAGTALLMLPSSKVGDGGDGHIGACVDTGWFGTQAADVPAWERDGPLIYSGGQLVFVPGLGIDARVQALPGQPQLGLRWQRG